MQRKAKLDLSVKENAQRSMNETAMTGIFIMNIVLVIAYLAEWLKGARSLGSYGIIVCLCIVPCLLSLTAYFRKKDTLAVRYICGIGFSLLYTYIMFTSTVELVFCYVIVAFVILVVYTDMKFLVILGAYACFVNVLNIVFKVLSGKFDAVDMKNAEISMACLILTGVFVVLAIQKISRINQSNIDKADLEKVQSEELLQKTLNVAGIMTENIKNAVEETEGLKEAIGMTQQAMKELTDNTNEEVQAIEAQKQSIDKINAHIKNLEHVVAAIVDEVDSAEVNLDSGNVIMKNLLQQVQISEQSNSQVAQKMEGLKEYADKMQDIMGLIRNVAEQTGLLALNASIEAEKAGESGRGFAVVATEIANLSTQTNDATEDINRLIQNIVVSIDTVTKSVESLLECNRLQKQYVDNTAGNFEKIHNSTQGIVQQVANLRETVDVVTAENNQVEDKIENVTTIMQKVMVGADETLESCNTNLNSIANVAGIMDKLMDEAEKLQGN